MNTSNLSQTGSLVAVTSPSPSFSWVSEPLHRTKAFLARAFRTEGNAFSASQSASLILPGKPIRFSEKSVYTPSQDWYGYR